MNILSAIGDTKMIRVRGVFAKLEFQNPTGSMKDRMAEAVIARAEERGSLNPGGRSSSTPAAALAHRSRWSARRRDIRSASSPPTRSRARSSTR